MSISTIHPGMASVYHINQGSVSNLNAKVNVAEGNGAEGAGADPYKVKISEEGQGAQEAQENTAGGAEGASGGYGNSAMVDAAIEKIKERMEAIKAQLEQLKGVEGEAAISQKKMLNEQLGILSVQLMELMAKKAESQG